MITEVWRFPRFWLILYSRSQFSTLPLDCLDEETQDFINTARLNTMDRAPHLRMWSVIGQSSNR